MNPSSRHTLYREHRVTIALTMLVMLSASIPVFGSAFLGLSFASIVVWGCAAGFAAVVRPAKRRVLGQKACILLAAFAAGVFTLYCHTLYLRAQGDNLVRQILEIKERTGNYPAELPLNFKHVIGASYALSQGAPTVTHDSVLSPFDRYAYDFEKRVFIPD